MDRLNTLGIKNGDGNRDQQNKAELKVILGNCGMQQRDRHVKHDSCLKIHIPLMIPFKYDVRHF